MKHLLKLCLRALYLHRLRRLQFRGAAKQVLILQSFLPVFGVTQLKRWQFIEGYRGPMEELTEVHMRAIMKTLSVEFREANNVEDMRIGVLRAIQQCIVITALSTDEDLRFRADAVIRQLGDLWELL